MVSEVLVAIRTGGPPGDQRANMIAKLLRQPEAGAGIGTVHSLRVVLALQLRDARPVAISERPNCFGIHGGSVAHAGTRHDPSPGDVESPPPAVYRGGEHRSDLWLRQAVLVTIVGSRDP